RVVHHRLVVDGQELLAHGARDGEEPGPRAAGENDSLLAADGRHVPCRVSEFRARTAPGFANTSRRRHTGATLRGDPRGQKRITHADRGAAAGAPYVADGSGALRGGGGARQHALRGGSRRGGAGLATARAAGLGQGVGLARGPPGGGGRRLITILCVGGALLGLVGEDPRASPRQQHLGG